MRIAALVLAFLLAQAYGAFGLMHLRFTLLQVWIVSTLTGVAVGVLLGIFAEAEVALIIMITSFWAFSFGLLGTFISYLVRKRSS